MSKYLSKISVGIPTLGREKVLLNTIKYLLELNDDIAEILIVDQTPIHEEFVEESLSTLHASGEIRWIRQRVPSIPLAMNRILLESTSPLVLFLDDDIVPDSKLISSHIKAHAADNVSAVVGQVLQPGQKSIPIVQNSEKELLIKDFQFNYSSSIPARVANVMAGNLSVKRDRAISLGGFDENFIGVAYRFESEFAKRMIQNEGHINFEPEASIRHLRANKGGTREYGSHLCSYSAMHGVGDYYYVLINSSSILNVRYRYIVRRLVREVRTKHHARNPWCIPIKLFGELKALFVAVELARKGQKLLHY